MRSIHRTYEEAVKAGREEHDDPDFVVVPCRWECNKGKWMVLSWIDKMGRPRESNGYPSRSCEKVVGWLKDCDREYRSGIERCLEEEGGNVARAVERFIRGYPRYYSIGGVYMSKRAVLMAFMEVKRENE